MRGRRLLQLLRSPSRAEPIAFLLVLAVLAQLWFVAPLALAMSSTGASASAPCHTDDEHGIPRPPASHNHAQCLLCTGGVGPLLATPTLPVLAAPAPRQIEEPAPVAAPREAVAAASYRSRAPPSFV
jgi:hypothetical protein